MNEWNNQDQSLSAATFHSQDAFERESSAHAQAPLMTGPMGMGPVVTGPLVPNVPVPMPFQVPLNPTTYPAYYQVPMTVPYPVRFDGQGYTVDAEQARFFPGPFYGPRPFFFPILPPPPFFFPPFFI